MRKKFYIAIIIVLFAGCANQVGLTGGDDDTIPPQVISSYPENGTINYSEDYIEIEFSEYVDKQSTIEAFYISPKVEGTPEFDFSGTELKVIFEKGLKANTTYVVSVGTNVIDVNNRNKMEKTHLIYFSTGDKIDYGKISGKVFDSQLNDIFIYGYKHTNDTTNYLRTKPDYISQINSNGEYSLPGLAEGNYHLIAVKDAQKDEIYNVEEDQYGCTDSTIVISGNDTNITNVNFKLVKEDTSKCRILNIFSPDDRKVVVELSEPMDSSKFNISECSITDSSGQNKIIPVLYTRNISQKPQYSFNTNVKLDSQTDYVFVFENILDLSGNKSGKISNRFYASDKKDTLKPQVSKILTGDQKDIIDIKDPVVKIEFNKNVFISNPQESFRLFLKDKTELEKEIIRIDDARYNLRIKKILKMKEDILLNIDMKMISDHAGLKTDSLVVFKLKVSDGMNTTGLSGRISDEIIKDHTYVAVFNIQDKKNTIHKANNKKFNFDKLKPGKYLLWSFGDKDNDSTYSAGKVNPYKFSEKFIYYPDTLNLRARWPVGDIYLKTK